MSSPSNSPGSYIPNSIDLLFATPTPTPSPPPSQSPPENSPTASDRHPVPPPSPRAHTREPSPSIQNDISPPRIRSPPPRIPPSRPVSCEPLAALLRRRDLAQTMLYEPCQWITLFPEEREMLRYEMERCVEDIEAIVKERGGAAK
ncbi:hypothetical protein EDC01DRAFT_635570 [Geopyxis carbonaria]|nr:hypothetical protein EDC01DRAFT_635570 [Geopyxis carbonaria]